MATTRDTTAAAPAATSASVSTAASTPASTPAPIAASTSASAPASTPASAGGKPRARRRNAAQTRQALLDAASARFARDGYGHTTVRDIADEAGVNVALISRYFTSKEGLFEACLTAAVTDLRRGTDTTTLDAIAPAIAHRIAGSSADSPPPDALLLLLRSSGDARADAIRRDFLHAISQRMADVAPGAGSDAPARVLRAQIVLAAALGMTLLRSTVSVEPLAGATEEDLREPLADLVNALLGTGEAASASAPPRDQL